MLILFSAFSVSAEAAESITYLNLISDSRDEVIIEKTISPREGVNETTINIYKYTVNNRLKLIWKGIKRMGFLSILDRLPPYEDDMELPFCLISDISMMDVNDDGTMEIEVKTKKVYYNKDKSKVITEKPVHTRIFSWDEEDQRYE
jgi:hypothetical protein